MIGGHAALLAWKAGRPVKIVYDRARGHRGDDQAPPGGRPASAPGSMRDGAWSRTTSTIVMDGGAYVTLSPVVLSRGALHARGPYRCPNVRDPRRARCATNTPPNGAFRGFGAPQTLFAIECQMERIAAQLGHRPGRAPSPQRRLRRATLPTGQTLRESVGAREALEACAKRSGFLRRSRECSRWNRGRATPDLARHRPGARPTTAPASPAAARSSSAAAPRSRSRATGAFACSRARPRSARARSRSSPRSSPRRSACRATRSRSTSPTPRRVPDSGPTVASRTLHGGGRAARAMPRATLQQARARPVAAASPATPAELRTRRARGYCGSARRSASRPCTSKPAGIAWDDETYRGDAYEAYGYGAMAVEVEVDPTPSRSGIRGVCGRRRHRHGDQPAARRRPGIEGVTQGLGLGAARGRRLRDGADDERAAHQLHRSRPRSTRRRSTSSSCEVPYSLGPCGAKGVGELPMDGPAPGGRGRRPQRARRCRRRAPDHARAPLGRARETVAPHEARVHGQRPPRSFDGPRHEAAARRAARGPRARPAPRRAAARASAARAPCCSTASPSMSCLVPVVQVAGPPRDDGRGAGRPGALSPLQARSRAGRRAVRHLHAGHAGDRLGLPARRRQRLGRRDPARARRQPLPLHRLPAHRARGAEGGAARAPKMRGDAAATTLLRPRSPAEAVRLIASKQDALPIAGGTDLMVAWNAGSLAGRTSSTSRRSASGPGSAR